MKEKVFLCGKYFDGRDTGERWNGFKVPLFTKSEAQKIICAFPDAIAWDDARETASGYIFDGFTFG